MTRNDQKVTVAEKAEGDERTELEKQLGLIILMLTLLTIIALSMSALYICERCKQRSKRLRKFGAATSEEAVSSKSSHSTPESFSTPPKRGIAIDANFEKRIDAKIKTKPQPPSLTIKVNKAKFHV